jgi:hypothetical protein
MGWWDDGILGGDTPLDYLGELADLLHVPNDEAMNGEEDPDTYMGYSIYPLGEMSDDYAERMRKALKDKREEVMALIDNMKDSDYKNIKTQVVAVVYMASGAAFPRGFKKKAVEAGRNDEWAMEDSGRLRKIRAYIDAVDEHKAGKRTLLQDTGLFQKMAEVLGS